MVVAALGGGLNQVAILDVRSPYTDSIHNQFRSWVVRARLDKAHGGHGNQVIWFNSGRTSTQALDAMDHWLSAIEADKSNWPQPAKIIRDRPADLDDLCGSKSGAGLTMRQCTGVPDGSVRIGAGGPPTDDVLQCSLTPLDRAQYRVRFSDAEWIDLRQAFPQGVCDYRIPDVEQQPTIGWQTYLDAAGQVRFGGAPLDGPR